MAKFKKGDRIRRTAAGNGRSMIVGHIYTVRECIQGDVWVEENTTMWSADYFELVEEKKRPWLRVIPPQPEKRELISTNIGQGIFISAFPETITLHSSVQHLNKDAVRELGETLIEISKEMKEQC